MKRSPTILLRCVIGVIGLAVLALCFYLLSALPGEDDWEFRILLVAMNLSAIPIFYALYQGLKLLSYIDNNKAFSVLSVKALRHIKLSALAISAIYAAIFPIVFMIADEDDAPGLVVVGMIFAAAPFVVATFAAVLQKLLQTGMELKSENDLTV